ncbi:GtrA family protein [Martelella alba]|uniref:GtrA family protein n=1 Tax=Martelella alba TaxID=2590451 RepID=A0ABY2SUB3_9HYPH|nr:GtrA family protein [Martelella alba]
MSGGLNTALTYAIYLLLLNVCGYTAGYTVAYVAGIVFAYIMNRCYVFKHHRGLKSIIWLPLVYFFQYSASIAIVWCWVEILDFSTRSAPLVAIAITLPMTYGLSRRLFRPRDIT